MFLDKPLISIDIEDGIKIWTAKRKKPHKLTKFGFANFRTAVVPVYPIHFKKLACVEHILAS